MAWPPVKTWVTEADPEGPPANPGMDTPLTGEALTAEFQAAKNYADAVASTMASGGSTASPLSASTTFLPLPTGVAAADTANLNTVLARGGRIRPNPLVLAPAYSLSAPLVLVSNSDVDFGSSTFTLTGQFNMLQNAVVTPRASATDATTTVGSSVVTSATLAAVAVPGQVLAVVGAGPQGGDVASGPNNIWLYGTVLSVAGNNITLTSKNVNGIAASVALSGATAYLFNRDSNISYRGGIWDSAAIWNARATRTAAGFNSHLHRLRRVDGLTVRDVTLKTGTFTGGLGWSFGINPADCTDVFVDNCEGNNSSTVVQGDGPLARVTVRNIRGTTQDDMVAFGCVSFQGTDTEGDITDLEVGGVQANNSWTAVKFFAGQGGNGVQRVLNGTIRSVKGSTQRGPINIVDYTGAGAGPINALIEDLTCTPAPGFQAITNSATYGFVHQHPTLGYQSRDAGLLISSFDPADASSSFTLGGGTIYLAMLKAPIPVTVTNLLVDVFTAGATLTASQCWAGLYDSNGVLWAMTAEQSGAWQSAGLKTMALAAQGGHSLTLPGGPGVFYWAAFLANGTTKPTFTAKASNMLVNPGFGAPYATTVPGARHRSGYESAGGRTTLVSLNGLTLTDNVFFRVIWAACT